MITQKEKLIQLLNEMLPLYFPLEIEYIADYLLAHGVLVPILKEDKKICYEIHNSSDADGKILHMFHTDRNFVVIFEEGATT